MTTSAVLPWRVMLASGHISRASHLLLAGLLALTGCGDAAPESSSSSPDPSGTYSQSCQVTFGFADASASTLNEAGVSANYPSDLGTFSVGPRGTECRTAYADVYARDGLNTPNDHIIGETFVSVDDPAGIEANGDLATCRFLATRVATPEDFQACGEAEGWRAGEPQVFWIPISVRVECVDVSEVPVPESTTTTLDACQNADCEAGSQCIDGVCAPVAEGRLGVYLEQSDDAVGALSFELDYQDSGLSFLRGGGPGACVRDGDLDAWMADCNFVAGEAGCEVGMHFHPGELNLGFISELGFQAPARLATCDVAAADLGAAVDAIEIWVFDASSPEFNPVNVKVAVRLEP